VAEGVCSVGEDRLVPISPLVSILFTYASSLPQSSMQSQDEVQKVKQRQLKPCESVRNESNVRRSDCLPVSYSRRYVAKELHGLTFAELSIVMDKLENCATYYTQLRT
jgi:hypothetical protein